MIIGPVLLCCLCCWLLREDSSHSELIKDVLQAVGKLLHAVGASVKVIVEAVAPGPMFLLALVLVLLVIAFPFLDRLNFKVEVIIGIAYGVLLVLAYCPGAPWRQ